MKQLSCCNCNYNWVEELWYQFWLNTTTCIVVGMLKNNVQSQSWTIPWSSDRPEFFMALPVYRDRIGGHLSVILMFFLKLEEWHRKISLACVCFFFQFIFHDNISVFPGKVGGLIASIPDVMVAALLCFMWAMLTALGLSNLRYSEAGSSRNIIIVGLSLFFSLSVPAYFQQYGISPGSNMSVPSYFQPYIVASHGPFNSKSGGVCLSLSLYLSPSLLIP